MYAYRIQGNNRLFGTVDIQGAKNAILPIMAASLLTDEPIRIENISYLSDVTVLSQLLQSLGMNIQTEPDAITLQANNITSTHADYDYVSKMRGSFWVLGPLLSRFNQAEVSLPGGCAIGTRPVDLYLLALREMGAEITVENGYICAKGPLHGAEIFFPKVSVGATHNTIMAAVLTAGQTIIHNPALEPEVIDLINLLIKMGAKIEGVGTKTLIITGVKKLHGCTHKIVPDRIESATFAIATAITKGRVFMRGARLDLMEAIADVLRVSHVELTQEEDGVLVDATQAQLTATPITTCEYPGFPTDAQALITALLIIADGDCIVEERIFENRFMHIPEMVRMGAQVRSVNNSTILISGVEELSGATVMSSDLRGGVGLVLAALVAKGQSIVKRIYHIDRGYYQLESKLSSLGAVIERIQVDD